MNKNLLQKQQLDSHINNKRDEITKDDVNAQQNWEPKKKQCKASPYNNNNAEKSPAHIDQNCTARVCVCACVGEEKTSRSKAERSQINTPRAPAEIEAMHGHCGGEDAKEFSGKNKSDKNM